MGVIALAIILWCTDQASADLADTEPPSQYGDWNSAYHMSPQEMGTAFDVRKDGGGDHDYIRMPFIYFGDEYYIKLDNHGNPNNQVEVWVHDQGRFPIAYHFYDGSGERNVTLRFYAFQSGPYYLQFGNGFGDTIVSVTVTGYTNGFTGDGNNMPLQAEPVLGTRIINGTFGLPTDPHDFYKLRMAPSDDVKVFMSFSLTGNASVLAAQWELYNMTGVKRESLSYISDVLYMGTDTETFDERIHETDTYYLRVWCIDGRGDYKLRINIINCTNDGNDEMENATLLEDGDVVNSTLNTRCDLTDWYKVNVSGRDHIQLWMDVDDDADIFLRDDMGALRDVSDNWGTESEYISYHVTIFEGGEYYILIKPSSELDVFPYRQISYSLRVVTNMPPEVVENWADTYRSWPIDEDEVDERIVLGNLFIDPEGGSLRYSIEGDQIEYPIRVTIQNGKLRLEPAENVSGIVMSFTVVARDDHQQTVNFTITVAVINVNDAPVVGHPTYGPPPEQLEVDEDSFSGPFDVLFWFWDVDNVASELTVMVDPDPEIRADLDDLDRLLLQTIKQDWYGMTNVSVTVRDPEGLTATIVMPVQVVPVNDAPFVVGPDITLVVNDRLNVSVDLTDTFSDIEDDPLTYSAESTSEVGLAIEGTVLLVEGLLGLQHTTVTVAVIASDPAGAMSEPLMVTLEVGDIPQPHQVTSPVVEYRVLEGSSISFTDIVVIDPDPLPSHYEVKFTVDDAVLWCHLLVTTEKMYWTEGEPDWTPQVLHRDRDVVVTLHIIDDWYNVSVSWVVHVRMDNEAPANLAIVPDKKGPYPPMEGITFTGHATDADEDSLSLRWELDGAEVGQGKTLHLDNLTVGRYELVLFVSDGFVEVSTKTIIMVQEGTEPQAEGSGWVAALGALMIIFIIVLVGFALRSTKRTV
jgi:hypothetical protein